MKLEHLPTSVLLERLCRAHEYALSAQVRAMQYCGYETGNKARRMRDKWQDQFDEIILELGDRAQAEKTRNAGGDAT